MTRVRSVLTTVVCGLFVVGCGSDVATPEAATPTQPPATTETTATRRQPSRRNPRAASGRTGPSWANRSDLPESQILYAARRPEANVVSIGLRDGGRVVRTVPSVLTPEDVDAPDGIDLYGGDVLGERGPDDRVAEGTYLLVGSVPGDVEVSVTEPGGSRRRVTGSSTRTLRGFTVFYDTGDWERTWDQVQLAPLTVTTSDGRTVAVRTRSWTG